MGYEDTPKFLDIYLNSRRQQYNRNWDPFFNFNLLKYFMAITGVDNFMYDSGGKSTYCYQ